MLAAGLLFGGMCFFVPLPWLFRTVLVSAVLLATVYYCLRYALLKLPNSLVALHINNKNQLQLVCKDGQQLEALVQANTVVTGYLTVLNCQLKEATFRQKIFALHVIILPDAVDAEDYRQLRVWLRWAKGILPQTAVLDPAEDKIA